MPKDIVHLRPAPTFCTQNKRGLNSNVHGADSLQATNESPSSAIVHANLNFLNPTFEVVSQLPNDHWEMMLRDHNPARHFEHRHTGQWAPLTSPALTLNMQTAIDKQEPETQRLWDNLCRSHKAGLQQMPSVTDTKDEIPSKAGLEKAIKVRLDDETVAITTPPPSLEEVEDHISIMLDTHIKTLVIIGVPSTSESATSETETPLFQTRKQGNRNLIALPYPYAITLDDHSHLERQRVIVKETQDRTLKSMELEVLYVRRCATHDPLLSPNATNQLAKYINGIITKRKHDPKLSRAVWIYEPAGGQLAGTIIGSMALQRYAYFGASLTEIAHALTRPSLQPHSEPLLSNKEQLNILVQLAKRHRTPLYVTSIMQQIIEARS